MFDRAFSVRDAAEVLAEPPARLRVTVEEIVRAGVLVSTDDRLSFRDQLVRDQVYDRMAHDERAVLHGRIALFLLEQGDAAGGIAHLALESPPIDRSALAGLAQAAKELTTSSPRLAADLAERVLDLTPPSDDRHYPRVLAAVDALIGAGRTPEAIQLARTTRDGDATPPQFVAALRLRLADVAVMGNHAADAVAEANAVLAMGGLRDDVHAAAEQTRLLALMAEGDFGPARQPAEAILGGTGHAGGDASVAGALVTLGSIAWTEGRVADAIGLFRAAAQRAEGGDVELHQLRPRQSLAVTLAATGAFEEAQELLFEERRRNHASGNRASAIAVATWLARVHSASGRFPEAVSEAESALALSQELQSTLFIPLARATLAAAALVFGDIARVEDELERSRSANTAATPFESDLCDWVEARVIASQDQAAQAIELMSDVYAQPSTHRRLFLEEPLVAGWLVRTALALRDRDRAEAIVTNADVLAAENPAFAFLDAAAAHVRGLVDRDADLLDQAAARHPHPFAAAASAEDAGEMLAARGDGDGARARLEMALDVYEKAGATGEADRVRGALCDLGVPSDGTSRTKRPRSGWGSLTGSERQVARYVADGLTNRHVAERMFLSRHTVDFHLRQVFRKLGINSRVELVAVVLEHGDA